MIFYFSGTGNSLSVAQAISAGCNDSMRSIPEEMKQSSEKYQYGLHDKESIGFVFPVYAWGPPKMVLEFIDKLSLPNYKDHFTYSIATCGDNIGNSMALLEKALRKKGMILHSSFSVVMPNNYIVLGDVDPKAVEERKLREADKRMTTIQEVVREQRKDVFELRKGPIPGFFTGVINPLFNKYALSTDRFYATDDCTACGRCAEVCPTVNIEIDGRPVWRDRCTQCLACIHSCPEKAIQYGKGTIKKGRYLNPVLKK